MLKSIPHSCKQKFQINFSKKIMIQVLPQNSVNLKLAIKIFEYPSQGLVNERQMNLSPKFVIVNSGIKRWYILGRRNYLASIVHSYPGSSTLIT